MTAFGTVEDAVEAMRFGAHDFVQKPFVEEELLTKVARAARRRTLRASCALSPRTFRERYNFGNIIGQSAEIRDVLGRIVRIAPTDATVLITGESGTGKELVARAIHANSLRCGAALRLDQLRRAHRDPARKRALRTHARRVHRRRTDTQGPLRRSQRRHVLLRRNRRDPTFASGEAPARDSGRRDPQARRQQLDQRRCAHHCGDQPGSAHPHRGEALSRGSLLPAQRGALRAAAAAGAQGGHRANRRELPREIRQEDGAASLARAGRHGLSARLRFPGEHSRARESDRAGCGPRARRSDSPLGHRPQLERQRRRLCTPGVNRWPTWCRRSNGTRSFARFGMPRATRSARPSSSGSAQRRYGAR